MATTTWLTTPPLPLPNLWILASARKSPLEHRVPQLPIFFPPWSPGCSHKLPSSYSYHITNFSKSSPRCKDHLSWLAGWSFIYHSFWHQPYSQSKERWARTILLFFNYTQINFHFKKRERIKKQKQRHTKRWNYRNIEKAKQKTPPHPLTLPSLETITVISSPSPSRPFYALLGMQGNSSFVLLASLYINGIVWGFLGCSLVFFI